MGPHTQIRENKTVRCIVVHELTLLRQAVRRLLEDEPDLTVVAEAENAAEALRQILEHRPDVVVIDAASFGCTTAQAQQMVLRESPNSRVVFLPRAGQDATWPAAEGVKYAARQTSAAELVTMVRGSAAPKVVPLPAQVREFPFEEMASRKSTLTER